MDRKDFEKYTIITPTCWIWKYPENMQGYGLYNGKPAHRAVYEKLVGPIPIGMVLDHLCMRKRCVNPSHLEPVSNSENVSRAHEFYKEKKKISKIKTLPTLSIKRIIKPTYTKIVFRGQMPITTMKGLTVVLKPMPWHFDPIP